MEVIRYKKNPIIKPRKKFLALFNPGVLEWNNKVYLLVRRIDDYCKYISKIDLYESKDGIHFKLVKENYIKPELKEESWGVEDLRVSYVEGEIFFTYTGINQYAWSKDLKPNLMLAKFYNGKYKKLGKIFENSKNASFLPRKINGYYVLFHRLGDLKSIVISYSKDLKNWKFKAVVKKAEYDWEVKKVGLAFQPIELKDKYILFYHGVDNKNRYSLGFLYLDKKEPWKVIYNYDSPIWKPRRWYEKYGDVPNVVFPTGYIKRGNKLYIYAGTADKYVSLAFFEIQ